MSWPFFFKYKFYFNFLCQLNETSETKLNEFLINEKDCSNSEIAWAYVIDVIHKIVNKKKKSPLDGCRPLRLSIFIKKKNSCKQRLVPTVIFCIGFVIVSFCPAHSAIRHWLSFNHVNGTYSMHKARTMEA